MQLSDWVWCPWSYLPMTFFLKCTVLQDSIGEECQIQSIIYMDSDSISFMKDKSSDKSLLVETAKE